MIGCVWTHVRKQPIIVHYFEFENELKFYDLGARIFSMTENYEKLLSPPFPIGGRAMFTNDLWTIDMFQVHWIKPELEELITW